MKNKRLIINIVAQILSFLTNTGVSFLLTPFIINYIGTEVYGFVGLSNNFISYLSVFTVAINSMLNRYVMVSIESNEINKAKKYFASTGIVNLLFTLFLLGPILFFLYFLDRFINLPLEFLTDIKLLVLFTMFNFLLSLSTAVFNISFFCKNRLDLASIRNIKSELIRVISLVLLFIFFPPRVYYIGLASLITTIYISITNIKSTYKLTPEFKLKFKYFDIYCLKELISVGIWNSINQLSHIFMTGLDLLITNILIGAFEMSLLSMAKVVPVQLQSLMQLVSSTFTPHLISVYVSGNIKLFVNEVKHAMNITAFLSLVPLFGFIVFGDCFFSLWLTNLPDNQIKLVYLLAIITILPTIIDSMINPLYHVFTITAKVKIPVIINLMIGVLNIVIVYFLLENTSLGVLAVAGISSLMVLIKVILFIPIYAANTLSIKWYSFYLPLFKGLLSSTALVFVFLLFKCSCSINSWGSLVFVAIICGFIGYLINGLVYFSPKQVKSIIIKVFRRGNKYIKELY